MLIGIILVVVFFFIIFNIIRFKNKQIASIKQNFNKFYDFYQLLNHWLEAEIEGKKCEEYFLFQDYQTIAIYGMADMANRLCEDLSGSSVTVKYGIDRDVCCTSSRISEIYSPEDILPKVDVIVVTPFYSFNSIKRYLETKVDCPIISIEDVIWSL